MPHTPRNSNYASFNKARKSAVRPDDTRYPHARSTGESSDEYEASGDGEDSDALPTPVSSTPASSSSLTPGTSLIGKTAKTSGTPVKKNLARKMVRTQPNPVLAQRPRPGTPKKPADGSRRAKQLDSDSKKKRKRPGIMAMRDIRRLQNVGFFHIFSGESGDFERVFTLFRPLNC
jgi:hypothetical protein